MRKASQILLLIAGIVGILAAVSAAAIFAVFGLIEQGASVYNLVVGILGVLINQGVISSEWLSVTWGETAVIVESFVMSVVHFIVSIVLFVCAIIYLVFELVAAIIALKSRGKKDQQPKKGLFIANFIFAGLTLFVFNGTWLSYIYAILAIGGSVLGLIALNKEKQEEENPEQPEDAPVGEMEEIQ